MFTILSFVVFKGIAVSHPWVFERHNPYELGPFLRVDQQMTLPVRNAGSNWFLTWDDEAGCDVKSFLLQIKLNNLVHRDLLSDGVNSFIVVYRRPESIKRWEEIGRTAIIRDEVNPEYPEGFRICYDQDTNLALDSLKIVCYNRRDTLGHEDVIGTAKISVRELVRTFGTKVQVELIRKKTNKVVGSAWFFGEALPDRSPRGGATALKFKISSMAPRRSEVRYQQPKVFVVVYREREDGTWNCVYRSTVVKRASVIGVLRSTPLAFKPFEIRKAELVLGMTMLRKVKFVFYQKGKHGCDHTCVGEAVTTVDELVNDLVSDTSIDLSLNGEVVGEFAAISRETEDNTMTYEVQVNYFDSDNDARELEERKKNRTLNLDSP